ncbi:hypothetical protein SAMN00120144_0185 [Hymenobacter roseosalivarius DSM 11622]|uniref:Uncharacterized protein n=1 Tax=Hymenobacter roseosalivarius DSM 11622 TaxID=645990 RepID=A0A1W1W1B4_9BACT|nr:hypothetical protein SAMN00120144_0185 [Hymenobacter roseosalivarius DSM 11622]
MSPKHLDRIGTVGVLLFGLGLTALGYGSFELFGGWTM